MLGFRPRNQYVARDAKGQAKEFRFAGDVLDGLALESPFDQLGVTGRLVAGEFVFPVGDQPSLVFAQNMQQQRLGILAGAGRVRP